MDNRRRSYIYEHDDIDAIDAAARTRNTSPQRVTGKAYDNKMLRSVQWSPGRGSSEPAHPACAQKTGRASLPSSAFLRGRTRTRTRKQSLQIAAETVGGPIRARQRGRARPNVGE